MSHDIRVAKSTSSLLALYKFLTEVQGNPNAFVSDTELLSTLRSQGALARYASPTKGIFGSSLNTAKRTADICLDGGFAQLDTLRQGCLEALTACKAQAARKRPTSRATLTSRLKDLEAENQSLREDLFLLSMILDKSLKNGLRYAKNSDRPEFIELSLKEHRELLAMVGLRKNVDVGVIIGLNDAS